MADEFKNYTFLNDPTEFLPKNNSMTCEGDNEIQKSIKYLFTNIYKEPQQIKMNSHENDKLRIIRNLYATRL